MTTFILTYLLERELDQLNREIDTKIRERKSYKKEAKLHKELLSRINKVKRQGSVLAMF